ncbi:unnamed protein product [Darwinula stevensoni]|uniref:Uncharacterized protein n=1 Tax=Darwinula stevensoni TaxID=69355 RepID=A0A7R9AJ65_9CRUS|nr:unnamed protein product [Darwinula stevensoni]CAG0906450.1 unnamed protein product [Darwinula stevensoni]
MRLELLAEKRAFYPSEIWNPFYLKQLESRKPHHQPPAWNSVKVFRQALKRPSEFLGKRAGNEFLGKRAGSEFLGKRAGSEFLGKRAGSEFLGKRAGSEFLGKRSEIFGEELDYPEIQPYPEYETRYEMGNGDESLEN